MPAPARCRRQGVSIEARDADAYTHRIEENDPYFRELGTLWNEGLKRAFADIPVPDGLAPQPQP